MIECLVCNKEFNPTKFYRKCCSKECSKENIKRINKKYQLSDKGKEVRKKALKKYKQTDKGKESEKRYFQSDKGKLVRKKAGKKYKTKYTQSDRGKEVIKKGREKYSQSAHGKETIRKYKQSDRGKELRKKDHQKRMRTDPIYKLILNARSRLRSILRKKNIKKPKKTIESFGCSVEFLKKHLEKQFYPHPITNEKMTWENHSLHGWHVDHIDPLDLATSAEDIEKLSHHSNLQPMWAKENLKKGSKITK